MKHRILLATVTLLLLPAARGSADLIHVPGDQPSIQAGIDAADSGDTVLVAAGTYLENIVFKGKAVTVKSEKGPRLTAIMGGYPSNPDYGSAAIFLFEEGPDSVLHGFTLFKGKGTFCLLWGNYGYCGGGIVCTNKASPTIVNCHIRQNHVNGDGGGLCILDGNPTLVNCRIEDNSVEEEKLGGGIYIHRGGLTMTGCRIAGNEANEGFSSGGGGMYNRSGTVTMTDCSFFRNTANGIYSAGGGGVYNTQGEIVAKRCVFIENESPYMPGGGIYSWEGILVLTDCVFNGNIAGDWWQSGAGVYNYNGALSASFCSFSRNHAALGGAVGNESDSDATLTHCVLWGDSTSEIWNDTGSTITVDHSCVQGGWPGTGNIDADPLFQDVFYGDLHIPFDSPCRDAGDNAAVIEAADFEGDPRIAYGTVDLGADEFYPHLYVVGDASPGNLITGKIIGLPGTAPVGLFFGSGVLDPPLPSMWGAFFLESPLLLLALPGSIPLNGVMELPAVLPTLPIAPYDVPMQALVGLNADSLTNVFVLHVEY